MKKITKSDAEWLEQLNEDEFYVTRKKGTERAFLGKYNSYKEKGVYICKCCGNGLFESDAKFDSGTGWPSYFKAIHTNNITEHIDQSHGMTRTEVTCSACDAHLGHLFPDGPKPTGLRYCINSISLDFINK